MEIEKEPSSSIGLNYAESFELYDRIYEEILQNKRKKIFYKEKVDHYTELFKTLGEERKEKIEEEKIKKKEEDLKKKIIKGDVKKINFDSMLKSNFNILDGSRNINNLDQTPNFNLNDSDNSVDFVFNNNMNSNEPLLNGNKKDILYKFNNYFEKKNKKKVKKSHSDDIFYIINFKKAIRKKREQPNCVINYFFYFNNNLKDPNIFDYRNPKKKKKEDIKSKEPKKSIKLNLDIYEDPTKNVDSLLKNLNYFNTNLSLSFFEHSNKKVDFCYRNFPYLDKNDNYTKSVIENYNEKNLLKNSKNNITIIIDSKDKRDRKVDSYQEQLSMQVKKIMRMKLGRKNMMGGLSDEEKLEILIDNDSEIRKLLMIDKAVDFNSENEIIKNKKRKIKKIFHSGIALHFLNHDFVMMPKKVINLYRPDISSKIILDAFFGKKNTWKFQVVKQKNENSLKKKLGLDSESVNRFGFSKKTIHSHEIFKKSSRLSLRSDDFLLFEYIEKDPLILSNFGMGSRVERWIYLTRLAFLILHEQFGYNPIKKSKKNILDDKNKLYKAFYDTTRDRFGDKGEEIYLVEKDTLPTLGQITKKNYPGVTILDNNLSRTPIFTQKPKKTDFLLICTVIKGKKRYYIRRIKTIYTAGQIQPKLEIFSPYSRQYNCFLRKLQKFYIKKNFEEYQMVNIDNIKRVFPLINDHNLRKQIRLMGGEEDNTDKKVFYQNKDSTYEQTEISGDGDLTVTPEDICLYERMHQSYFQLYKIGIEELKSTDKISVLKTKYYRKNIDNVEKTLIAKRIIEDILLSSWNVSQSFLSCTAQKGRMYLTGFGDPTNGHGGINFIKLPLKISRYESMLIKLSQKNCPNPIVSGTKSDLRGLAMPFVHKKLKEYGYSEEVLSNLERWDKIEYLRDIANEHLNRKDGEKVDNELLKFARNIRMTTEKQKEKYQKDINEMFMLMLDNLGNKRSDKIKREEKLVLCEDYDKLMRFQEEELKRYKLLDESDEEKLKERKPRVVKQKRIVLKPNIKKKKED